MAGRKLLFYTHAMAGGGAERVMAWLASGFAERGDEVHLVCDWRADANAAYLSPKVRYTVLDRGHAGAVRELARLLREEKPDVAMSAIGVSNLKLFLAGLMSGRVSRCVQSVHGFFHTEPQLLCRLSYLLTPLSSCLFARTVAVSDGLATYLERFGVSKRRRVRIYNPVATRAGEAAPTPLDARPPVALSAGRFTSYKNFPLLVRAFAKVRHPEARLVILGEGDDRPRIEAQIAACGLGDRVELPGYEAEPWSRYAQARCFVSSSDSEPFGLVVVEALAAGLPVVVTATDGPREIVNDPAFGVVTPIGDEDALARAIEAALDSPGESEPRRRRARDFDVDAALDAYGAMFDEIVAPKQASPDAPRLAAAE